MCFKCLYSLCNELQAGFDYLFLGRRAQTNPNGKTQRRLLMPVHSIQKLQSHLGATVQPQNLPRIHSST